MIKFEISVTIKRPVEEVFAFANDLESDPQWISAVAPRKKTSQGPVGVGTTFRDTGVFLGRQIGNNYEITEYEPPTKLGLKTVSGAGSIPVEAAVTCEPVWLRTRSTEIGAPKAALYCPPTFSANL